MPQFNTFFIPMTDSGEARDGLNAFLRGKRVMKVDRAFAGDGWAFCVEWLEGNTESERIGTGNVKEERVDYMKTLPPEEFAVFSKLREARKALAIQAGVEKYEVATNEQLAQMAKMKAQTLNDLKKVKGFGEARLNKYGEGLLVALTGGESEPVPVVDVLSMGGEQ